jgi:hypothetical protein
MELTPVPGRACGACTLCCKVMKIVEIGKPPGRWCANCRPGQGCAIYAERPGECRQFFCGWLTNPDLSDEWKPERSKIVVTLEGGGRMVAAHVDSSQPDAWRRAPFFQKLKQWARIAERDDRLVLVRVGARAFVIFPDRETDLGLMDENDLIATRRIDAPQGSCREAIRISPATDPPP